MKITIEPISLLTMLKNIMIVLAAFMTLLVAWLFIYFLEQPSHNDISGEKEVKVIRINVEY